MSNLRNLVAELIGEAFRWLWRMVAIPVVVLGIALVASCFAPGGCVGAVDDGVGEAEETAPFSMER